MFLPSRFLTSKLRINPHVGNIFGGSNHPRFRRRAYRYLACAGMVTHDSDGNPFALAGLVWMDHVALQRGIECYAANHFNGDIHLRAAAHSRVRDEPDRLE
jgi:hypothetical protein